MKNFNRNNQLLSLCGLNCGLCPMLLDGHCGGCGNGNQSCKIARCSLEHGSVAYCYECTEYPCEKYESVDQFDSFISHRNQKVDLEKAKTIGIEQYNAEQQEKIQILHTLLDNYNDGRKKTFFCVAVNVLALQELKEILAQIEGNSAFTAMERANQCKFVSGLFEEKAQELGIEFKLRKKR